MLISVVPQDGMLALRWSVATVLCGKSTSLSVVYFMRLLNWPFYVRSCMIVLLIFHDLCNNFLLYFLVITDSYNWSE